MEIQPITAASPVSTDSADLGTQRLIAEVLAERRKVLDGELRSAAQVVEASNAQIHKVNQMTTSVQFGANEAEFGINDFDQISDTNRAPFVERTMPNGNPMLDVGDGYGVVVEHDSSGNRSWQIVEFDPKQLNPDGSIPSDLEFKSQTRIWGDPHVDEGHDGGTDWDFVQDSTFITPNGTKISVETKPFNSDGDTVSSRLSISAGEHQAIVDGLDDNHGTAGTRNDVIQVVDDGSLFGDADVNDGHVFVVNKDDGSVGDWKALNGDDLADGMRVGEEESFEEVRVLPMTDRNLAMLEKLDLNPEEFQSGDALIFTQSEMNDITEGLSDFYSAAATDENIAILKEAGIEVNDYIFNGKIVFSPDEREQFQQRLVDLSGSLRSKGDLDVLTLQELINDFDQINNMQTKTEDKRHTMATDVIRNI